MKQIKSFFYFLLVRVPLHIIVVACLIILNTLHYLMSTAYALFGVRAYLLLFGQYHSILLEVLTGGNLDTKSTKKPRTWKK